MNYVGLQRGMMADSLAVASLEVGHMLGDWRLRGRVELDSPEMLIVEARSLGHLVDSL
jgi:hypothetical protein